MGSFVQGSIGFAFVLVAAPVIGLIAPAALPETLLVLALPMGVWMSFREIEAIDLRGFGEMFAGRLAGTAAGAWILVTVAETTLSVIIGGAIVLAAFASLSSRGFRAGRPAHLAAGIVSGIMGTVAAIGGPAMALACQTRSAAEMRSTIALSLVAGSILSLAAIMVARGLDASHVRLAFALFPAEVLGLFASGAVVRNNDPTWMRLAVVACAAVGGGVLMSRPFV